MVGQLWILGCVAALLICSHAWEFSSLSELQERVQGPDAVVVAFIVPSDEKSKSLDTQWQEAAIASASPFLSIDCASDAGACETYGLSALPSVKLFRSGEIISTYQGPRRATAISAWVARAQRPSVSEVADDSLKTFQIIDETVFIAHIDSGDAQSRLTFETIASRYDQEFTFGIHVSAGNQDTEEHAFPAIECYRPLDGDTRSLKGQFDEESLVSFVKEASRPIIGELLPHNHQRFLDRGWSMVYVFALTEAERAELRNTLGKMARSYYDSLTMVTVDPLDFPDLPAKLGLDSTSFPAGAVHQLSKNRIYPYPKGQQITPSALQKWGLDVWQGRVKPWQPAGATPAPDPETPGRIKATRKVSIRSFPGMKINIGHDEL